MSGKQVPLPASAVPASLPREALLGDIRQTVIEAKPAVVFAVLERLGGNDGLLWGSWPWRLRRKIDGLLGLGASGRDERLALPPAIVDFLDSWRVLDLGPPFRLLLESDAKRAGRTWLQFSLTPQGPGQTLLLCCAWFEPKGHVAELYWWALHPLHRLIFRGLLRQVKNRAEYNFRLLEFAQLAAGRKNEQARTETDDHSVRLGDGV